MKIALVCPYDWSVEGGVKTHITQLAHHFREWGEQVTVFAPASDPDSIDDNDVVVMGKPSKVRAVGSVARITFAWRYTQVREALEDGKFDIVHLHEPLVPLLPYYFLRHSTAINIGTFHAAHQGNHIYGYTRPLTRRWFRKLDGKIAVSAAAAGLVSRYFAGYYNIIPNGIDYHYWSRARDPWPEFQDGMKNILFVGRPEKRKGLKYLLRAYMRLRKYRDDVRLIIVGAGNFQRYQRLMEDYPDVVFFPNVPYEDLPRYHYTADVMCCPNTGGESQGYVLMEALATGTPVVASNIEGFAGVVTDGVDAVLVPPKAPAAIASALDKLLDDEPRQRELGRRGQMRAEDYSWDKVARRVHSYYERLLHERRSISEQRQPLPQSVPK